uniref:WW domain-containing protein n=1 Tax=Romanomermis culicivorax TaxID=13658 RepID=A0A915HDV2_ROMCU
MENQESDMQVENTVSVDKNSQFTQNDQPIKSDDINKQNNDVMDQHPLPNDGPPNLQFEYSQNGYHYYKQLKNGCGSENSDKKNEENPPTWFLRDDNGSWYEQHGQEYKRWVNPASAPINGAPDAPTMPNGKVDGGATLTAPPTPYTAAPPPTGEWNQQYWNQYYSYYQNYYYGQPGAPAFGNI